MISREISLTTQILSWAPSRQSSAIADDQNWRTPYRYWKHAENLLAHPDNEHFRIDCVGNLKRAIDHRLKRLTSLYRFKKIPDASKPSELLDVLGYFGIARPTMLREVSEVRNLLEHHYKSPPPHRRCQELVEFSWYFLRSTDLLSTSVLNDFVLRPDDGESEKDDWIEVTYGPETDWKCTVRGWVPDSFVSSEVDLGITIRLEQLETAEEFSARAVAQELDIYARRRTGVYFTGRISGKPEVFTTMTTLYFSTL
ncbi:MAG: hypothetical protein HYZ46_03360 [Nitrosomonadales bacterium]|nr:hypothetical protein [Nitrosomonadales bacterium]